jgi:hypothetical protein
LDAALPEVEPQLHATTVRDPALLLMIDDGRLRREAWASGAVITVIL